MDDAPLPNENSIILKSDKNIIYKIKFIANDNYLLLQSFKDNKDEITYEDKIHLNTIKLNKYFSICDSIFDVMEALKQNLSNKIKLEEINNELKLIIPLNHPLAKEITFNLKIKQKEDDLIHNLYNIVKSLSQKIENQQEEINSLKNRVNILENKNKTNNDKPLYNNNYNNNIFNNDNNSNNDNNFSDKKIYRFSKNKTYNDKPLINYNNNHNKIFINDNNNFSDKKIYRFSQKEFSYIIRSKDEDLSIKNWIHGNKQIRFNLLFRMSRDGTTTINFHTKCDFKGKTLILIETKDGKRFGGYTSLQWNMDGEKRYGENIWLFNLEKTLWKYPLIKMGKSGAIICQMDNGPSFEEGIIFKNNDLSVGYLECQALKNAAKISDNKFNVKEMEIFQVNIKY